MEAIILAGGLGTRLAAEVPDLPKCMAPVAGKPFLEYVLRHLESCFFDQVVLALGYRHREVREWLNTKAFTFKIHSVIEKEPLGTGGAVKLALHKAKEKKVFVLNGDTLFRADLRQMAVVGRPEDKAVVALKPMKNSGRYGMVQVNDAHRILGFQEKGSAEGGLINGGVYYLNREQVAWDEYPDRFSLEKDFLEQEAVKDTLCGFIDDGYFIDIGIPEDYRKAQKELIS